MANNLKRVSGEKWPGVYCYASDQRKFRGKPDICYYVSYKADGRKTTEKVGWKSEGYSPEVAAELRANRVKTRRHGGEVQTTKEIRQAKQASNQTIDEISDSYFGSERGLKIKGRPTDLNRYEKHLKKLFGSRRVDTLTVLDIQRLKGAMKSHAPATIANALELLRRLTNHGVKAKICPPLRFTIELPKRDNEVTEYLTEEEAERLMRVLEDWPTRDAPRMLKIAWLTGLRRGEIFKIENRDCDFDKRIITLRNPKGGKTVSVPMSKAVADLLEEQIADRDKSFPDSTFIFPGKYGQQRTDCSAVDRIKTAAELPKSFRIFHGLRHHLAVTLANSGAFTLDMIGALLTHKSSEMTRRYAHFLPDAKKQAAEQAAEILQAHANNKGAEKVVQLERVGNGN